jgi:hypothetical protein
VTETDACETNEPANSPSAFVNRVYTYHVPAVGNEHRTVAVPVALSAVRSDTAAGAVSPLVFDAKIVTDPGAVAVNPVVVTETEVPVSVYTGEANVHVMPDGGAYTAARSENATSAPGPAGSAGSANPAYTRIVRYVDGVMPIDTVVPFVVRVMSDAGTTVGTKLDAKFAAYFAVEYTRMSDARHATPNAATVEMAAAIAGLEVHTGTPFTNSVTVVDPLRTTATCAHTARVNAVLVSPHSTIVDPVIATDTLPNVNSAPSPVSATRTHVSIVKLEFGAPNKLLSTNVTVSPLDVNEQHEP